MTESEQLKEEGIERAAKAKPELLELARKIARSVALEKGEVNADDVAKLMPEPLGNASGAIFKRGFVFTGKRVKSKRPHAHANELKVWKLS